MILDSGTHAQIVPKLSLFKYLDFIIEYKKYSRFFLPHETKFDILIPNNVLRLPRKLLIDRNLQIYVETYVKCRGGLSKIP